MTAEALHCQIVSVFPNHPYSKLVARAWCGLRAIEAKAMLKSLQESPGALSFEDLALIEFVVWQIEFFHNLP